MYYLVVAYYYDNERNAFDWHPLNYPDGFDAISDSDALAQAESYYAGTGLANMDHVELSNFTIVEREMIDQWGERVIDNRWPEVFKCYSKYSDFSHYHGTKL